MKPSIYITRRIPDAALQILHQEANVKIWDNELPPPYEVILNEIREVDWIVTLLTDKIDQKIIEVGKKLKIISNYAVGYDNVDLKQLRKKIGRAHV